MPGHRNKVALSAIKLGADENLRRLKPEDRKCLFPDENKKMKLHQKYSQANCFLECSLFFAQELLVNKSKTNVTPCTPWFFPFLDGNHRMCESISNLKLNYQVTLSYFKLW